ncbi:hypothetical protein J6590_007197 [Homalodisca vitripennis]|nr:hypothetical protein J6590_007197 [Homalodisca vitripennis]
MVVCNKWRKSVILSSGKMHWLRAVELYGTYGRFESLLLPLLVWQQCDSWRQFRFNALVKSGGAVRNLRAVELYGTYGRFESLLLPLLVWQQCDSWRQFRFNESPRRDQILSSHSKKPWIQNIEGHDEKEPFSFGMKNCSVIETE